MEVEGVLGCLRGQDGQDELRSKREKLEGRIFVRVGTFEEVPRANFSSFWRRGGVIAVGVHGGSLGLYLAWSTNLLDNVRYGRRAQEEFHSQPKRLQ